MTDDQFKNLVNLYLDNEIAEDDLVRLKAEVEHDPRRRELFRRYSHMNEATRRVMDDGQNQPGHSQRKSRSRHSRDRSDKHRSRTGTKRRAEETRSNRSTEGVSSGSQPRRKHRSNTKRSGSNTKVSSRQSHAQQQVIQTGTRETYLRGLQSLAKWGALAACIAFIVNFAFDYTKRHQAAGSAALEAELAGRVNSSIHPAYMFAGVQVDDPAEASQNSSASTAALSNGMDSVGTLTAYPLGIRDAGAWQSQAQQLVLGNQMFTPQMVRFEARTEESDIEQLARSIRNKPASNLIKPASMNLDLVPARPQKTLEAEQDHTEQIQDAKTKMDRLEAEAIKAFENGEF